MADTPFVSSEIFLFLKQSIAEVTDRPVDVDDSILYNMNLVDELRIDSLDYMNILFHVEEHYGIRVPEPDIDAKDLYVVRKLVAYIENWPDVRA